MACTSSTPEEDTKDKSLDDDYDELDIKIAAETARNHNTIVDAYEVDAKPNETVRDHCTIVDDYEVNIKANEPVRDHNTIVDDYEVDNDLKTGDSRVHSLPSECESGYDETPSECDLIVGEVDGEAGNLSVHDTEDEGRGSTRGACSNLDYIDEGRDSVETEYAPDDSAPLQHKHNHQQFIDGLDDGGEDNSLSAVTEISSCADTETVAGDEENQSKDNAVNKHENPDDAIKQQIQSSKTSSPRSRVCRRGGSVRNIPTTRSVELRAGRIQAVYPQQSRSHHSSRLHDSRNASHFAASSNIQQTENISSGLTKSESLHSRISSAGISRGSRNSSPVASNRSPRARSANRRRSPNSASSRRLGTYSTLSSPGRPSTAGTTRTPLERSSPECRRSCAASPLSSAYDRRGSPFSSMSDRQSSPKTGSYESRSAGLVRSFRKQNSPKHTSSTVTTYSSLKRPPKPRSTASISESERLARSSSVSTISSLSSRSSGSRSKSFRELHQARLCEPEPFSCSRDCSQQWKQSQQLTRLTSNAKAGGKGCKGKPIQLWEIQQTLGRGDFVEGVLNVDFSNGLESFIYAPIQLGRADGHFDRSSQYARRVQR